MSGYKFIGQDMASSEEVDALVKELDAILL